MVNMSLEDLKTHISSGYSDFSEKEISEGLARVAKLTTPFKPYREYFPWDLNDSGEISATQT